MIISGIKREKKHLFRVDFDNGKMMLVDADVFSALGLNEGDILDGQRAREIIETSDYERAKKRALWYLDRSDHTEKALYDKLIRAGFNPKACAKVIARLCELGVIDDRRFALRYAERCTEANISKRETYAKLMQKGVPRDIIKDTLEQTEADEPAQIRALIDKRYKNKLSSKEDTQKVYAALIRKGFSFGAVKDVLKAYNEELLYISEE